MVESIISMELPAGGHLGGTGTCSAGACGIQ